MAGTSYVRGKSVQSAPVSGPVAVEDHVAALKDDVFRHPAVRTLERFGERLRQNPLKIEQIWTLLASEAMFVLEVPPGILRLASRITDEWLDVAPFQATGRAARILFAAVDEYGLNQIEDHLLPSHHELYADMAAHFGMTERDLVDSRYIVPSGFRFAKVIRDFYRERPIIEGLGFHIANEATAPLDFGVFLETFRTFRDEYGFQSENDRVLNFLLVHDDVEVSHREMGVEMLQIYSGGDPAMVDQAREGVMVYMACYGEFFAELEAAVFRQRQPQRLRAIA
jgi:pyrroloquinoline quinone (PQQ) biosynthesis protein C